MGALIEVKAKTSETENDLIEVDVEELILRLKSIASGCSIEVVQLAISSMLDEIEDAVGDTRKR